MKTGAIAIALITAFAVVWLVLFRKECRFPQALLLIPAGMVLIFLLNALRIATLILIGDRGFTALALGGFHSQAGWLAFNVVAFGFSVTAHEGAWFRSRERHHERSDNPVVPWVLPLVILLGAGMMAYLATAGFEWLYPICFFAGAAALWHFRASYRSFDWRISWRGPTTGVLVFAIWLVVDRLTGITAAPIPQDLASASAWPGAGWLLSRILGACLTVPLIEGLAFRGFLLRRFTSPEFETVPYAAVSFSAILITSVAFGALHGDCWLAVSLAGFLYAAVTIRTGRLSEAIAAHATTNALIAVAVLAFHQWQLW